LGQSDDFGAALKQFQDDSTFEQEFNNVVASSKTLAGHS
jgi:hypothetical protein